MRKKALRSGIPYQMVVLLCLVGKFLQHKFEGAKKKPKGKTNGLFLFNAETLIICFNPYTLADVTLLSQLRDKSRGFRGLLGFCPRHRSRATAGNVSLGRS